MNLLKPTRRAFISGGLGIIAAPAVVRAESLMRIFVPKSGVLQNSNYSWWRPWSRPGDTLYICLLDEESGHLIVRTWEAFA